MCASYHLIIYKLLSSTIVDHMKCNKENITMEGDKEKIAYYQTCQRSAVVEKKQCKISCA